MAACFSVGDKWDDAYNNLKLYLGEVSSEQSNRKVNRSYADNILNPSKFKDVHSIKGFKRYDIAVRKQFNKWMVDTPDGTAHRIQGEGNDSVQPCLKKGGDVHSIMRNSIFHLENEGGSQNKLSQEEKVWFKCVHKYLKDNFKVSLVAGSREVPLRGFAYKKDEGSIPEFNFWDGNADAVGLLKDEKEENKYKYVVVDWKGTGSTSNTFWEDGDDPPLPYRDHLTQCLVYARLLKMHLSLAYLPPILIVPFNLKGEYMHPRLFTDYPDQCKEAIEKYQWSTDPPLRFKKGSPLKDEVGEGLLLETMKLKDAFEDGATVQDLCKALKFCRILVKD